jgi:hypothetical protein
MVGQETSGFDAFRRSRFQFYYRLISGRAGKLTTCSAKNVCQLEGSDRGGRDSAAELALAGTIDVQVECSCNRLTLGPAHPTKEIILLRSEPSTDLFTAPDTCRSSVLPN